MFRWKQVDQSGEAINKKAGAERRLPCYATNGAYFFFLAPPFFAAFFFFAAIVLSMERVLNAGPIPRWIGRQQPDANTRLVPRADKTSSAQNCDRLTFSNSNPAGLRSAGRSAPAQRNRQWSPASALDNHIRTLKGVKQTSRSCKGGASNLPTTRCVSASEALS